MLSPSTENYIRSRIFVMILSTYQSRHNNTDNAENAHSRSNVLKTANYGEKFQIADSIPITTKN